MLRWAARFVASHWLRGAVLMGSLFATTGVSAWAATPIPTTGLVVDAGGRPVAGAAVSVAATVLSPAGRVTTDQAGRYRVGARRWPYQEPAISVSALGFQRATTHGGRLVLLRWPEVDGRVLDDTGSPVPGAVLSIAAGPAIVAVGSTDMAGRFALVAPEATGIASLSAGADLHDAISAPVTLAVGTVVDLQLTLPRQMGTLHIDSDPQGESPVLDGMPAPGCPSTPCDITIIASGHTVAFRNDHYVPWSQDVALSDGVTTTVQAKLDPKTGTLTLTAPGSGDLLVDGNLVGGSQWSGRLPVGQHSVSFRSSTAWPDYEQVTVNWGQTTDRSLSPTPVTHADTGAFTTALRAYLNAQGGGSYGVYLEQLSSGATIGVGDTTALEAASVIKVPEALYLLSRADGGKLQLSDQIALDAADFMSGTGSLYGSANPGDKYSYQQLLALLIQQSDNTAWRALRRVLGDSSIDAYASSLGAGDCVQETDNCSARSAGHLLAQLARGKVLSSGSTSLLLNLLETTVYNDRIPYYLGGTSIAHKVGMDPDNGVANDCGVVFWNSDPFAVCVFTTTGDPNNGAQVIRDIARAASHLY